jgi:beta-galactosidase
MVKNLSRLASCFLMISLLSAGYAGWAQDSRAISFDADWRFERGTTVGAESPSYDDHEWRRLDLPHDWSIEDLTGQKPDSVMGPFTRNSVGKGATGFTEGGVGWYRKHFSLDKKYAGKRWYILFDGVYMNADVWVNGQHLGVHPYGYTAFYYELTDMLHPSGQSNTIAVRVQNEGRNSRWYSGSGIYRHVWLIPVSDIHIPIWGTSIGTPDATARLALVRVTGVIANSGLMNKPVTEKVELFDADEKIVGSRDTSFLAPAQRQDTAVLSLSILRPRLWTLASPALYTARVTLIAAGKVVDRTTTAFGIRTLHFDGNKGFLLNGQPIKLKGGCIHHDLGPLGAASIDRAEERKVELLKKAGYNALRMSHNPPSVALLNACDRLGMLVVDEAFDTWEQPKNPEDYHLYFQQWWPQDVQSMLLRDRNHPSIILWSIGNEIFDAADSTGYADGKALAGEVRRIDPTRGVIEAIVYLPPYTRKPWEAYRPQLDKLDIDGYNYFLDSSRFFNRDSATLNRIFTERELHPGKLFMATEYVPDAALENWLATEKYPYILGGFCWTAMDYLGEAGIGRSVLMPEDYKLTKGLMAFAPFYSAPFPVYNAYCGDLDLIGNPKAASGYKNVVWGNSAIDLEVHRPVPEGMKEVTAPWGFPDEWKSWTWPGQDGKRITVHVYTRSKVVRLELNGKQIAEEVVPEGSVTATFEINYHPGTLVAKAFDNGQLKSSAELRSSGPATNIRLVADRKAIRADRNDLSFVSVAVTDKAGRWVPADDSTIIHFQVSGVGTIAAVGNGSYDDASSFQQPQKRVYHGRAQVIIRPKGPKGMVTLTATGEGLAPTTLKIEIVNQ